MSATYLNQILRSAEQNANHMARNAPQDQRGQEFAKAAHAAIADLAKAVIELHKRVEDLEEKQ
ncbi:hypothetical protein [Pseudomonas sp. KK4]|uniref:hypothetical protein n=1 Tax=Pseudomonas sp. KK4 TaxID=1855729 RepID=UPI0011159E27|nr:hypothetical protein [Pseudomonas sp. KK4]